MARLGFEPASVDLIIGPSKRRPKDDIAMRAAFAADRARPESGKASERILRMLAERRPRSKGVRRQTISIQ